MSERPFPPSPRRLAEARRVGRVPWSPALVTGAALAGGAIAIATVARAWADAAGRGLAGGARSGGIADPVAAASAVRARDVIADVVALAAPLIALVAAAALIAHVAQTRAAWLPRRASRRLPAPADGADRRIATWALGAARALAVGAAALGVVASAAAALAARAGDAAGAGALGGRIAAALFGASAAAAIGLGVVDWLERARRHRADLSMSARELRDERRESEADPRWRRARGRGASDDVRGALVVIVGDDDAVALAWHPRWQPEPAITAAASGRGVLRLVALARRHRVPVHRDAALAAALRAGRVPAAQHGAVARVVVAVGG